MNKKTPLPFVVAALLIFVAGCASPHSERAAKMARTEPKAAHQSDREWFAQCTEHSPVWRGQPRTEKEWAIRDAAAHEKEYSGHHCTIEH